MINNYRKEFLYCGNIGVLNLMLFGVAVASVVGIIGVIIISISWCIQKYQESAKNRLEVLSNNLVINNEICVTNETNETIVTEETISLI